MRVLSLYDGMACGMLAMIAAGVDVEEYHAYEIDKYAIQTSLHNFPQIQHHGDVFEGNFLKYEGIDWLIGGSPCTYWSIAQTNNRETSASGVGWELFQQYVRALCEAKPRCFIYENNASMSKDIRQGITQAFGFDCVEINSALVSAQNRRRLYFCGIRQADGTYRKAEIPQPEDRGILLRDVLDGVNGICPTKGNKSHTVLSTYGKAEVKNWHSRVFSTNPNKQKEDYVAETVNTTAEGKSQTLKAQYANTNERNICCYTSTYGASGCAEPVIERIGTYPNNAKNQNHDSQQYRIYSTTHKSVNLCGNGGGHGCKNRTVCYSDRV